jgi:hypothetical protein
MPYEANKESLVATFTLSPGAYAKATGKMQRSRITPNSFNYPVSYRVFAENRIRQRVWIINVHNAKNPACDFLSFTIPGLTRSVQINPSTKSILIEVNKSADLRHLPVNFVVSTGASAWIGRKEQFSNTGTINFSGDVQYRIIAEDGVLSCMWTVMVRKVKV